MIPCVGAGALPTLRREVADGGAIVTELALPGPASLVNIAHFQKLNELGPWKIDHVMCRCLELDCSSPLQIELTRSKKIAHIFPERCGATNLTYSMSLVYQRLEPS